MVRFQAALTAGLLGLAASQAINCAVTGKGVVVSNKDKNHKISVVFEEEVQVHDNIRLITYDADGNEAENPTLGEPSTFDFKLWSWTVEDLKENYSYKAYYPSNQAHRCTKGIRGTCAMEIQGASVDTPGGNLPCNTQYLFSYTGGDVVGTLKKSTQGAGQNIVRFTIDWNRPVAPLDGVITGTEITDGIHAVNDLGEELPLRDLTFGKRQWSFSVRGANGDSVTVSLEGGKVATDLYGGVNAATEAGKEVTIKILYPQDCRVVYSWTTTENYCDVEANCAGKDGKVYAKGILETATAQSIQQSMGGGKACPYVAETRYLPCTCKKASKQCGEIDPITLRGAQCGKNSKTHECSCASDCLTSSLGCCSDIATACTDDLPSCGAPAANDFSYPAGSVQCQESARAFDGSVLCYCDQWCTDEDNCCKDFDDNCFEGLCQKKAVGDFCNAQYIPGQYDGCQCDRDCLITGDCCRDYTTFCSGTPLCANSGNCNKMMGSSTGSWCMCDHACLTQVPSDCCSDYEAKCEVQATCAFRDSSGTFKLQPSRKATFEVAYAGVADYSVSSDFLNPTWKVDQAAGKRVTKYSWTPIQEHIPAFGCGSVRFTDNDSWCSCDDECNFWGDCCPDYFSRCLRKNW
jgi:hypothetical protein